MHSSLIFPERKQLFERMQYFYDINRAFGEQWCWYHNTGDYAVSNR